LNDASTYRTNFDELFSVNSRVTRYFNVYSSDLNETRHKYTSFEWRLQKKRFQGRGSKVKVMICQLTANGGGIHFNGWRQGLLIVVVF